MLSDQAELMHRRGYLPAAKAAQLMKCSVYTIYRWAKAKEVPAMQLGSHWYVQLEGLRAKAGNDDAWAILVQDFHAHEPSILLAGVAVEGS